MINIKQDFIPKGRRNRPGYALKAEYITIHDTANSSRGADAESHAKYLKGDAAARRPASWHYTVDDKGAIQHLPINENGWAAGDGSKGPGNRKSIQIEICENVDGDRVKAEANAAKLVAILLEETNLPLSAVVQHGKWSGKNCPHTLRARAGGWESFLKQIESEQHKNDPLPAEKPAVSDDSFKDVPAGHWSEKSIVKAKEIGLIKGYPDGTLGFGEPVTIERLLVILDGLGELDKGVK